MGFVVRWFYGPFWFSFSYSLNWRRSCAARCHAGRPWQRLALLGEDGGALGQHLAAEDPHLAADLSVGGLGLGEAIVDVGAQRVQRHPALAVPFVARHLRAAQTAGAGHADSLGAELLRGLDGLLHRPAEGDAPLELGGDVLRHQLRVRLRLAHFDDVEEDLVLGELLQLLLDALDARPALADDDARPRSVDVDLHLAGGALDLDLADAGLTQLLLDVLTQLDVLVQPLGVVLHFVPLGIPGADHAEAEADRIDFLTHVQLRPFFFLVAGCDFAASPVAGCDFARSATGDAGIARFFDSSEMTSEMWLVFFSTLNARPIARGM